MGSLAIGDVPGGAGVLTEGDFEALCRMEVSFKRKKGEYFACYDFGTAITPDSDQMVRIGTVAMIRLLVRCGSFLACYSKLSESEARRLRAKVADPSGFAGLEIEDTGYESFEELVAACRASGWVLDAAALDRPLFPGVDEDTGRFLFSHGDVRGGADLQEAGRHRHQDRDAQSTRWAPGACAKTPRSSRRPPATARLRRACTVRICGRAISARTGCAERRCRASRWGR